MQCKGPEVRWVVFTLMEEKPQRHRSLAGLWSKAEQVKRLSLLLLEFLLLRFNFYRFFILILQVKLLLLHTEQGDEVTTYRSTMRQCYYRQLKEEGGLANCIRTLSVGEQFPGTEGSDGGSYGGYFLHILSICTHSAKEHFIIPLSLTQERYCHSHGTGHWDPWHEILTAYIHSGLC